MRLDGKVALITGGARGMGANEAMLFAQEGAKVVICDVIEGEGRRVEAEIKENGGEALFLRLDVTDEEEWLSVIGTTIATYGKLDILVNNAGISAPSRVANATREEWERIMDVNATGVFLGTKYAIAEMRKSGGGSIINISSIFGLVGAESHPAYQASKGAVRLLTKAAAVQHAKDGIRVNSVHPGFIATPLTEPTLSDPVRLQDFLDRTPIGRVGQPEDVAYGVLYLASDESSFVTGSELVIDGGYTAH